MNNKPFLDIYQDFMSFSQAFQDLKIGIMNFENYQLEIDENNPHNILLETLKILSNKIKNSFDDLDIELLKSLKNETANNIEVIKKIIDDFNLNISDKIVQHTKSDVLSKVVSKMENKLNVFTNGSLLNKNEIDKLTKENKKQQKTISHLEVKCDILISKMEDLNQKFDKKYENIKKLSKEDLQTLGLRKIKRKVKYSDEQ